MFGVCALMMVMMSVMGGSNLPMEAQEEVPPPLVASEQVEASGSHLHPVSGYTQVAAQCS